MVWLLGRRLKGRAALQRAMSIFRVSRVRLKDACGAAFRGGRALRGHP